MIEPLGNRVAVEIVEDEVKAHGQFAVAEGARKDKPLKGRLLSDFFDKNSDTNITKGNIVYFCSYGYEEIGEVILVPVDLLLGVELKD